MKRSRWGRVCKKVWSIIDGASYAIMVYRDFEKREQNVEKATGETHRFCEDKYILF